MTTTVTMLLPPPSSFPEKINNSYICSYIYTYAAMYMQNRTYTVQGFQGNFAHVCLINPNTIIPLP